MTHVATYEAIKKIPKLELHIHLEGCISFDFIKRLCEGKGLKAPVSLNDVYPTDDLSKFLSGLDWVCSLINKKEYVEALVEDFGKYCKRENIVYCELIVNPTHWAALHYSELLPSLADCLASLHLETGIDVYLLPSILRQQSSQDAVTLANWIISAKHPRIVGISVDGNEKASGPTGDKFASAYASIREAGLKCTAHAGESSGAEGVRSALDELKVHRLDHGVRVIEDAELTQRVIDEQIPLNVCVSSNCHLLYKNAQEHPFETLQQRGVLMTLNTDDPVVLKTTLSKELAWVAHEFNLSLEEIVRFQHAAVQAAFCSDDKKASLLERIKSATGIQ